MRLNTSTESNGIVLFSKNIFLCILLRAVHVFLIDTGTNYALTLDYNKRDLYFDKKIGGVFWFERKRTF